MPPCLRRQVLGAGCGGGGGVGGTKNNCFVASGQNLGQGKLYPDPLIQLRRLFSYTVVVVGGLYHSSDEEVTEPTLPHSLYNPSCLDGKHSCKIRKVIRTKPLLSISTIHPSIYISTHSTHTQLILLTT